VSPAPDPGSWFRAKIVIEERVVNVTERSNAAAEERLKSGHTVGGLSIV
jgi:hypothetical protein